MLHRGVIMRMKALTLHSELACLERDSHRSWMGQESFDRAVFQTSGRFQALTLIHTWIFCDQTLRPHHLKKYYSPNAYYFLTAPLLKNRNKSAPKPRRTVCSQMLDASQVSAKPLCRCNSIFTCSSFARLEKHVSRGLISSEN